jgi:hypothetical protein
MRWLASIAFGLMHAACSGTAATPDAHMVDASIGGLIVELVAKGGVPQMPAPNIEIERLVLGMTSIRAIGDAAPGDVRTTRTDLDAFEWADNFVPIPYLFPMAPPGLYSMVELHIAKCGECDAAIIISGHTARGGERVFFEVRSSQADASIGIKVNTELSPRTIATTTIAVDVAALVADVDWNAVPLTADGKLLINDGDPGMASVVTRVATAFSAAN